MKNQNNKKSHPAQEATRLGEVWITKSNFKKGEEYFLQALKFDPMYEPAIVQLASLALRNNQLKQAAKYFEEIANLAIQKHLYTKGTAALQKALQYDLSNVALRERLKKLFIELGRVDEAEALNPTPTVIAPTKKIELEALPEIKLEELDSIPIEEKAKTNVDQTMSQETEGNLELNEERSEEAQEEPLIENTSPEINIEKEETITEMNLADLSDEEIDYIADVEVLIAEGEFDQAEKLLAPLKEKYQQNGYIKLVAAQIKNKDVSLKSFILTDSKEPEIDLSGALK